MWSSIPREITAFLIFPERFKNSPQESLATAALGNLGGIEAELSPLEHLCRKERNVLWMASCLDRQTAAKYWACYST